MSPQCPTRTMSLGGERSTFGVTAMARAGAAKRARILRHCILERKKKADDYLLGSSRTGLFRFVLF